VGPQAGNVDSPRLDKDAQLSSWLPGIDVAGARDGSWGCLHLALLYLTAKPSHARADADGLACPLHSPIVCGWQMRVHSFLIGAALSHHATAGSNTFLGGVKPPGPDIWCGVDHRGPWWTESYVEKPASIRACLSSVRVIIAIMDVPLVG
jgi:hypothetical protein